MNRKGFTLAEVLITLGIIGVVAAMTIPTLIQNSSSTRFASQFKKTVSTLSQAALMAQAQYDVDYSLLGATPTNCGTEALSKGNNTICGLLNNTLTGHSYLGTVGSGTKIVTNTATNAPYAIDTKTLGSVSGWLIFALADGSYVGINPNASKCNLPAGNILNADILKNNTAEKGEDSNAGALNSCLGFIDANGQALPNREVECIDTNTTSFTPAAPCAISMTGKAMGDVFPIVFHNGTVEPATNAAKTVLTRGK